MLRYAKYSRVKNTTWLCRMKGRKRNGWVSYLLSPSVLGEYITACCLSAINWCWNPAHGALSDHIHHVPLPWKESLTHVSLHGTSYHFQLEFLFTCRRILQIFLFVCLLKCLILGLQLFSEIFGKAARNSFWCHMFRLFSLEWKTSAGLSIISTHLSTSSTTHFS